MTWLYALPLLLVGLLCWAVIGRDLRRYMRNRNRYRSTRVLGRPYRDPRQWSQTYMNSLRQER